MRNTDITTAGVAMRLHERMLIRLSKYRPFRQLDLLTADRLCEHCLKSGRCVTDMCRELWYIPTDELGCLGWCQLLVHLEDKIEASSETPSISFDDIPF